MIKSTKYIIYDKLQQCELEGVYDNKESILIAIFNYIKVLFESDKKESDDWLTYAGERSDFLIYKANKPSFEFRNENIITDDEYVEFMKTGPRIISLKKIIRLIMKFNYKTVTEKNTQCRRDNLKRSTDAIIPILENFFDSLNFKDYNKEEVFLFLRKLKKESIFEFGISLYDYGAEKIPNDEIWIIIHNRVNHHCRIEIKINSIFRRNKIDDLLGKHD